MQAILDVKGMSCQACVRFVQTYMNNFQGVEKVEVNLETEEAIVTTDSISNVETLILTMNEKTNYSVSIKP